MKTNFLFIIFVLIFTDAHAQKVISVGQGATAIHYRVIRALGAGRMGVTYVVLRDGQTQPEAIKIFNNSPLTGSNIEGYRKMSNIFAAGASSEYLNQVTMLTVSVDGGPTQTVALMSLRQPSGMQQIPDLRKVTSDEILAAKITDLLDIWRSGVRGIIEAHKYGLAHNDVTFGNMLRNTDAHHYILNDYDMVTTSTSHRRGGSAGYIPADFSMNGGASLDGDLYGLAISIAEQMTGQSFHVFESMEEVPAARTAEARVRTLRRELQAYIEPIYEIFPPAMAQQSQVLRSLVMFINASLHFDRADREAALGGLLIDPNFEDSMKADLGPMRSLSLPIRTGRGITPVRSCLGMTS